MRTGQTCVDQPLPSFRLAMRGALEGARLGLLVFVQILGLAACGGDGGGQGPQLPVIVTQPADHSIVAGNTATFSVVADGAVPLAYQWSSSPDGTTYTALAGASGASYSTAVASTAENGMRYRVVVSNGLGSVTSSPAQLTVSGNVVAPAITTQPADQSVVAPAAATFTVTATGTSLSYAWKSSSDGGATFAAIVGAADAPSLAITSTTLAQSGNRFRVVVSNAAGSVTSNAASLNVAPTPLAPVFTTQPAAQSISAGQAVDFSVVASGTPTPSIQWRIDTISVFDGTQASGRCSGASVAGAGAATLTVSAVPIGCNGAVFSAVASNRVAPDALSNDATLAVQAAPTPPAIGQQPADASVQAPAAATFTVAATGVPTPAVQWQQSSDSGATWVNINSATSASYTTPATVAGDNGKRFRAVFANASGSATSNAATLSVSATTGNVVDAAGGTLSFLGGAVTLSFPPGAVSAPTTIDVQPITMPAARFPAPIAGTTYELQPTGTVFGQPVTVTIHYDAAQLPAGSDPATMRVGKSTGDGWNVFASTTDTVAATVSANIGSFSPYGVLPGLQALEYGPVPGMAARYFDWPGVRYLQVATDPAGAVYIAGAKYGTLGGSVPVDQGGFIARLNADLSVQWVRSLPNNNPLSGFLYLRVDQQGNAYAGYDAAGFPNSIAVVGFNANGTTRSGFPVSWSSSSFDSIRGMAIDPIGNIHVFGRVANLVNFSLETIERGSYTVVRGGDGSFANGPTVFALPGGPAMTRLNVWDMGLDFAGNVYFTSTWFGNGTPAFGGFVSSFAANTLQARAAFPKAASLPFFIGKGVNSLATSPLLLVPVTDSTSQLLAFNVVSGGMQPGFPLTFSGAPSPSIDGGVVVDLSGNSWVLGRARPADADGLDKTWLGSVDSSGRMRAGFPRIFGGPSASTDEAFDIAIDPAGTAYVVGRQSLNAASDNSTNRVFIIRQPAL